MMVMFQRKLICFNIQCAYNCWEGKGYDNK